MPERAARRHYEENPPPRQLDEELVRNLRTVFDLDGRTIRLPARTPRP